MIIVKKDRNSLSIPYIGIRDYILMCLMFTSDGCENEQNENDQS